MSSLGDLTYAQLREQVLAVTATLRAQGVSRGDVVAVMGPKNAEQVAALLGITASGAAYLPIGVDQPADRADRILRTAGVHSALVCGAADITLRVPSLTVTEAVRRGLPQIAEIEPAATDPGELAYVLFTSGSTGEPKGVEITHDAAMNTVEFINRHFEIGPADRCLALSTLEGDLSVLDIFGTTRSGGAIVVVDEEHRRNPDSWARQIHRHGVTVLHFMPGWLEMLAEVGAGQLDSVRVVPTGGDWVRPDLVRAFRDLAPGVRFAGLGGATETATHNTICEPGELPPTWTSIPFGRPLPNNACRVVDAGGDDCPDWVPGEFWVSGRGIATGYRGRADLTAERFVRHDGRTWYRTGDLVRYLPDGTLEFVGRADHRVKISGYRVELGEVEAALRRVTGVRVAVAADVDGTLCAAADTEDPSPTDPTLTPESIRAAVAALVPDYMVPRRIWLVDAVPYTVGGKIDRIAVRRALAELTDQPHVSRTPATALERALAHIVGDVLGTSGVGVNDDFFTLGGDSVSATTTVARIRTWLDTPTLMVADIFATRNVAALAALLQRRDDRLEHVAEVYLEVLALDLTTANLTSANLTAAKPTVSRAAPAEYARWIRRFPGATPGATVIFPHAGGAAATYRSAALAFAAGGSDVYVVQYPQHPGRLADPAATTIAEIADGIFAAGPWEQATPLRLFGHCMGSVVAFEFARIAERHGISIAGLWVSGGAAPCALAGQPPLPITDDAILADLAEMGGTDARLLEDPEFVELLVPAVRADYSALNRYTSPPDHRVDAGIAVISAADDERVSDDLLGPWASHTTGRFTTHRFDGGHFYLFENLDAVARLVNGFGSGLIDGDV